MVPINVSPSKPGHVVYMALVGRDLYIEVLTFSEAEAVYPKAGAVAQEVKP
jgi:hypothetical protein